ncbi:MAG: GerAB/ArcD/ProY family transporter [Bacillota bacterium]|jgi:spore germination protein KB
MDVPTKNRTEVTAAQFALSLYPIAIGTVYFPAAGILVPIAGTAGWLAMAIAFAVGLLWAVLAAKLGQWAPPGNFPQAVFSWWGPWIGRLMLLFLVAVSLWLGSLLMLQGSLVFHAIALPSTPPLALTVSTLFLIVYSDWKGIEVYLRTVQFLTLLAIPLPLGILWGTIPLVNLQNLLPVFGTGPARIAHATYLALPWAMEGTIFTLFLAPLVKDKKKVCKAAATSIALTGLTLTSLMVITVGALGRGFAEGYAYPSAQLALNAPFGGFLNGLELFFYPLWLVSTYIKSTAFFILASESLRGLLPVLKQPWRCLTLGAAYLALSRVPRDSVQLTGSISRVGNTFIASLYWLLPLLAIYAWWRRRK